jgi:glutathione-regulated potassium-efflux system ancillary protein KefG
VALGFINAFKDRTLKGRVLKGRVLKGRGAAAGPKPRGAGAAVGDILVPPVAAPSRPALVILAHPALHRSRANAALIGAMKGRSDVTVHDLYRQYPDFLIDVEAEQKKLLAHRLIVLQYPMYWYATPALLKEWFDTVLLYGFAFGRGGTRLHGKTLLVAMTTGGDRDAYHPSGINRFPITDLLRPVEATAHLCGLAWAEPFIVHDAVRMDDDARAAAAGVYDARVGALITATGS